MAMLPIILDMVDEFYSNLDDQSKAFPDIQNIPLFFMPQRSAEACGQEKRCKRGPMNGCQIQKPAGCPRRCPRGSCATPKSVTDEFQVSIDVKSFKPEEISVKVKDREIIIEGKHEERQDQIGFVSRQFSRRCTLPEEFDPDTIATFLNNEGQMTIKATKPQLPAVEINVRTIPIQRDPVTTKTPAPVEAPLPDQEWEKVEENAEHDSKKSGKEVKE